MSQVCLKLYSCNDVATIRKPYQNRRIMMDVWVEGQLSPLLGRFTVKIDE